MSVSLLFRPLPITLRGTPTHIHTLRADSVFRFYRLDQGCRRQRVWAAEGYRGGDEDGVHVARRRGV